MDALVSILFQGLAAAMVLYIISVGLSITMGLMHFVNLAHGAFAMAGGYVAFWIMQHLSLPFVVSVFLAVLIVALFSIVLERGLYSPLYGRSDLDQVLFTIGLVFVAMASAHFAFGPSTINLQIPEVLRGQLDLGFRQFPAYRVLLIVVGVVLFVGLWFLVERTSFGARLRAGVDNRKMAESIGIRTDRLFTFTFALGSGLAALGGALGAQLLPIRPAYALEILILVLIIVAVGGLGTVHGPFLAALLLGISDSAFKYLVPQFGAVFIYVAVFVILLWRPQGLFGRTPM